ncbi:MAG: 3-hydroxyacyl-CoA dehydrogenase NAD-binding domain-containing protein [Candidatus Omnitrophota bacterium]|nr:3-hydroxyacyl-CoA dehydrogenase NAD-binding domain-containing protein [Candidatus Omnitrophota bacterium]
MKLEFILSLKIENGFAVIEFDQPEAKVNVLSSAVMKELEGIIAQLASKPDLKGLLVVSKKPDIFIAGADIKEIENIASSSEAEVKAQEGQKIFNALEKLSIPSIALINGACLGGGLELALACDYRLACFGDKVKIGLPEVKLGIVPGFGGTKRLPRLVGLQKGLQLILAGEVVSAGEALKIGLVDGLASQNRLLEEGIEFLKSHPHKRRGYKPRLKGWLNKFLDRNSLGRSILKDQTRKLVLKTTKGQYPAPLKALEAVVENYSSSLERALEREAQVFGELVVGEISKNLISLFYLTEKYKKTKWSQAQPSKIGKCAVLGAGAMGGGIAQLFSAYGLPVRMKDLNYPSLGRGLRQAREVYDYAVKKKKLKKNQAVFGMGLISSTLDYSGFANADLVVEAVVEDMKIKQAVFGQLDSVVSPRTIIASNTSCLSVERMSEGARNKERVIGMHFFNPVHRMPLIELIRTPHTSEETISTMVEFSRKLGKTPIVVRDSCGFLVNRILLPYLNEAGFILEEGISFERIDKIMLDFGMPMGPFTLMDEIGLDVGYKVACLLEENLGARLKVPQIFKKVYEKKWFGKKTGQGFYIHRTKEKEPNKEVNGLLPNSRKAVMSDEDILSRMLYRMINEAAFCLEEKVCNEPADVDIGMIMGTGFPPFRGGLLRYADKLGAQRIARESREFVDKFKAERFSPCGFLVELAKINGKFYR